MIPEELEDANFWTDCRSAEVEFRFLVVWVENFEFRLNNAIVLIFHHLVKSRVGHSYRKKTYFLLFLSVSQNM